MPNPPKFAHIVYRTGQPTQMRDWYCAVLDGHVVYQDEVLCFITYDDEHHRVALLSPPTEHQRRSPAIACAHHTAYTFDGIDDLLERYVLLRDKGIAPAVCIAHGITTSMYYEDPDGNMVEMQVDNFADPNDATAYMNGPEYAGDSVGPAFDPEVLLRDRRAGVSAAVLADRSWSLKADLPNPLPVLVGS